MSLTWRVSNAIMCLFFGLASYVQHNDEYALFWITVYALPCFTSLASSLDLKFIYCETFHRVMYLGLFFYVSFSLYLFYRALDIVISNGEYNLQMYNFQEAKELFGVIIIQSWILLSIYILVPVHITIMTTASKVAILGLSLTPLALWVYHGCFGQEEEKGAALS